GTPPTTVCHLREGQHNSRAAADEAEKRSAGRRQGATGEGAPRRKLALRLIVVGHPCLGSGRLSNDTRLEIRLGIGSTLRYTSTLDLAFQTLMTHNVSSRPLTAASSRATFETASTVDLSRPVSAIKNTTSGRLAGGPSAGPCRAALVEVRKVKERKAVEAALSRWCWEKGKLETESARNAETSGKAPSLTAADGFGLQGDPSCVMMKKVIHSSWLLPGRYDKRTREISMSRGSRNDENRRSDASARGALLLKMRDRRQEQLDEIAALAARLKLLGTEINPEVLERALVLPEQRLREAASFPAMPRLLSDPNLPNAGAVAHKRRVIKKKGGKKKRAGIGRKTK
ncbi:hypothetical protein FOZ63_024569, partial [Perkinsus olseni]